MKHPTSPWFSLLIAVSFVLASCSAEGQIAGEVVPTGTPSLVEEPPTQEGPVVPIFEGIKMEARDCSYGGEFQSVAAVDAFTVKFTLCYPDPAFLSKIASTAFSIQPAEHLEASNGSPLENPIGTGPYMVGTWEYGRQLVLKAFPEYWGEKPKSKTLVFHWDTNAKERLTELQSGLADGVADISTSDFDAVRGDPNLQFIEYPTLNVMYFGFNNDPQIAGYDNSQNPFANEKVRQAVAYGLDRERIVEKFYSTDATVPTHFTPCAIPNGCVGDPWYVFSPEYARVLLTQAGYPDGFETKIYYRNLARPYIPMPKEVVEDLKAQLKENLNIDAEIIEMGSSAFLEAVTFGHLEGIHLLGWEMRYPDQTDFLDTHFGSDASAQFGDKFDDITESLAQADQLVGDSERRPFYVEANNAIKRHVPMIPVAWGGSGDVYRTIVKGAHASPLSDEKFARMFLPGRDTFTWVQSAEPASLYCPDETNAASLRACGQILEALYGYKIGSAAVEPALAELCEPNDGLDEWTCHLRQDVKFHDGSSLDANDVVTSFVIQWDAGNPLHTGHTGTFSSFNVLFGPFLNIPGQ